MADADVCGGLSGAAYRVYGPAAMVDDAPPPRTASDAEAPWLASQGPQWRVTDGPDVLCDNPWFAVDAYAAIAPTGAPARYYVQRWKNAAVGVVPLHPDGTVTLVGQWRFPFGAYSWELPEGGAPLDETPLNGARRELREEAGLIATDWREILTMQLSNACSNEVARLYLATGLSACEAEPEATEALALARPPFTEALDAALAGRIQDSLTVAGLLRVHHMAVTGELEPALAALIVSQRGALSGSATRI